MTRPALRQLLFGLAGGAAAIFVHLLPAPWQVEPPTRGGVVGAPSERATPVLVPDVPLRRPIPDQDLVVGVPVVVAEPAVAPQVGAAGPGGRSGSAQPMATPRPAEPPVHGVTPGSAALPLPARAPASTRPTSTAR